MQELAPTENTAMPAPGQNTAQGLPAYARPVSSVNPLHSKTESTLAPTAEFTRIFLLAWIVRYIFRGMSGLGFGEKIVPKLNEAKGFFSSIANGFEKVRASVLNASGFGGRWLQRKYFPDMPHQELEAAAYSGLVGVGSTALTLRYSAMVRNDIINLFSESVGYEFGKDPSKVTFDDITKSRNALVKVTVKNYHDKMNGRLITDGLFFGAIPFRSMPGNDILLGLKGLQIFSETWQRKSTVFEDLITFVNNKINPRNGLGQPVSIGEVFDLYQRYAEQFAPHRMFSNVVENGTGEGATWATNQPVFKRISELMNLTYAYKHPSLLDQQGHAIQQADFPLPKFIYMLGHDLIDTHNPVQTLAYIEVANKHGMEAVKDMQAQLAQGIPLDRMLQKYPIPARAPKLEAPSEHITNSITKGTLTDTATPATTLDSSTLQVLERAEATERLALSS
jgi:hypothetical protein